MTTITRELEIACLLSDLIDEIDFDEVVGSLVNVTRCKSINAYNTFGDEYQRDLWEKYAVILEEAQGKI